MNPFTPYCLWNADGTLDWEHPVNTGLFTRILDRLGQLGGLGPDHVTFNEELLKLVLDRMCAESGIDVWRHSLVVGCERQDSRIRTVQVATKAGMRTVTGACCVDATGDADLAAAADCPFVIGDEEQGLPQPMTLCFRIANVNVEQFRRDLELERFDNNMSAGEIDAKFLAAKKLGRIARNPRDSLVIINHLLANVVHFNSTRVLGRVAVRNNDLSEAEAEGREQVFELYRFLKDEIPGFQDSYLLTSGPQIGVRESRRIEGETTVTSEQLLACHSFDDSIARGTWHIELHNPRGEGTRFRRIPAGRYYTVPMRALYSRGVDNLLVVGRAVSATQIGRAHV